MNNTEGKKTQNKSQNRWISVTWRELAMNQFVYGKWNGKNAREREQIEPAISPINQLIPMASRSKRVAQSVQIKEWPRNF